jgi:selenoprotein W-related protein
MKPSVNIEYCPKCGWLLRAAYMAQELLTTFADDLHAVSLQPATLSGTYIISVDGLSVFDRKIMGRFPEIKELKQLIRDQVNPQKSLGHSDKPVSATVDADPGADRSDAAGKQP